jgi:DNA-binding NtrC family response regulator
VKLRVLVVDDEPPQRQIVKAILEGEGYETECAATGQKALGFLEEQNFDAVLADLKLPDMTGIGLLEAAGPAKPSGFVIVTAHGSIDTAVEAMRKGAFDYLTKPLDRDQLLRVVGRAAERSRLVQENLRLKEQLTDRFRLENLVGAHGSIEDVLRLVRKVADTASTVFIYGESGTGKEVVARAIHQHSSRRERPFFAVNIAALPETLLEAELFGYEKGAFTGADTRKIGLFEQASGSTLFLDEVGDLKKDLQVKLLRVLQEREIQRVGGTERIRVDVRIVAATNQDLELAVREKKFREDLYYRLNVIPIMLPPLRERRTDIPLLAEHFLAKYGGPERELSESALQALCRYHWPGNVRELESVIERAVVLGDSPVIDVPDLPAAVRYGGPSMSLQLIEIPEEGIDLEALEKNLILQAMEKTGGNVTRAARLLGLSRRTMQYRLEKIGCRLPAQSAPDRAAS